jgi:hypothetical protein
VFESVKRLACGAIHFVNLKMGNLAGERDEQAVRRAAPGDRVGGRNTWPVLPLYAPVEFKTDIKKPIAVRRYGIA